DAWVTPPAYTGVAPLYLSGNMAKSLPSEIKVPQNSELTIRISGKDVKGDVQFTPADGKPAVTLKPEVPEQKDARPANTAERLESRTFKVKLATEGKVSVASKEYAFTLIPDKKPEIA